MERSLALLEPRNLGELQNVAEIFAKSGMFKDVKEMAIAYVKIMAGRELGFGAFASMTGVYIIEGKATYSANIMAAAIKRHASPRYDYRIRQHDETVCKLEFFQDGQSVGMSAFTIDEARRAKLTTKPTWTNYPKAMLFARALSQGARWYCPDVFGAPAYTPEELGADVDEEGIVIDADAPVVTIIDPPAPAKAAPQAQPPTEGAAVASEDFPNLKPDDLISARNLDSLKTWIVQTTGATNEDHAAQRLLKALETAAKQRMAENGDAPVEVIDDLKITWADVYGHVTVKQAQDAVQAYMAAKTTE